MTTATKVRPGWRKGVLEDLVFLQRGYDITKAEQQPGNVPVVSSSGIHSYHSEARVEGPGVVIGRKGSLGTVHYVGGPYWPHDTTLWSRNLRGNHPRYVYYFLQTMGFEHYDVGNSNPTLNRNHIHGLAILIPSNSIQQRIASVLAAYDDLIENNARRIKLLEESARLLHEEWFVLLRFPGHEHTPIHNGLPEGWEPKVLCDLCQAVREAVHPSDLEPDTPYIGLQHIPRRSITLGTWGRAEDVSSSKHRYFAGDILFGKIRAYFHKVGIALTDGITSSDAIVMRPETDDLRALVLMTASSNHFVKTAAQTAREGSKMPRADWKVMQQFEVPCPPRSILKAFNDFILPILDQLRTLTFQNQKLQEARDLLLPRLMSGEIPV